MLQYLLHRKFLQEQLVNSLEFQEYIDAICTFSAISFDSCAIIDFMLLMKY